MHKLAYTILITFFIPWVALQVDAESHLASANSLPLIGIRINGGARYTNQREIEVEIKSLKTIKSLLASMKVGLDAELANEEWIPYSEEIIKFRLTGDDGEKRVYAQLKDKAGNISPIESNKIIFDTTPPTNPKIAINKGEKYTNDKLGRVLVNVRADKAQEVMISNTSNFQNGRWIPYREAIKWILDLGNGEGEKIVFAKFRDFAGNESEVVKSSIILDTTPPRGGSLTINDKAKYARSKKFKLIVRSADATKVRIVSRGVGKNYDFNPDESGKMQITWITDSLEGVKNFKAYFMDEARNTTNIPVEASIIYKTNPPAVAKIYVDQGHKYTNNAKGIVSVRLSANENPQSLRMLISNKPNFEGAKERPFINVINSWQLESEEDGLKTIYVRLIDQAGNISKVSQAEIILDRTPPEIKAFSINEDAEWCISLKVVLNSDVNDANEAQYSNNINTLRNVKWEKYTDKRPEWTILPGDGEKNVYARYKDNAGNISETTHAKITLDMTPPKGKLIINGGRKETNHPDGKVNLQILHDADVIGMQITNTPTFEELKLLPLEEKIENWQLDSEKDGPKNIFMRLRDKAGNYSKIYASNIILDREPPKNCELIISNNDPYVRNKNKRVALSLRAEGANEMMISNDPEMKEGQWVPFKTAVAWTLAGPEGIHYVHAKFKDAAGNESVIISKMIKSDFTPPQPKKFDINGKSEYCTDPQGKVNLLFEVDDAIKMAISNNSMKDTSSIAGIWEPFKNTKEWKLEGEDGLKLIYARFKDEAGNVSREISSKIIWDRMAPTDIKISINNGAEWLNDKEGKSDISMIARGASHVMLSNSKDFSKSKWEAMTSVRKDWQFNVKKTTATLYAKFKDNAGNISEPVSTSIKIDITPPKNASISIEGGLKYITDRNTQVILLLTAEDATKMRISRNKYFRNSKWEDIAPSKSISLNEPDGEIKYYAQYSDDAGNFTSIVSCKFTLDTTPPQLKKFVINDGAEWTNQADKKVTLTIDAKGANQMMISETNSFAKGEWVPYKNKVTDYVLPGEDGEKTIFIKLKDEAGNISKPAAAKINLKRTF